MDSATKPPQSHALVIGGSMGGLLAARVLAERFERVTVLDRDTFPDVPEHRSGVPQSRHAHGILVRGQQIIAEFFPGIMQDLHEAGATTQGSLAIVSPAGKLPLYEMDFDGAWVSRTLLEHHVRERLRAVHNVRIISQVEVTDLIATPDKRRVTGVNVRRRNDHQTLEQHHADLVVDLSGRTSKAPEWLAALGYDVPPEETINSGLGYASRFYKKPYDFPAEWAGLLINGQPPHNPRAGLILPVEHDTWHVTVGGFAGHYPPTDEVGFLGWAEALPDPSLYEAIRVAQPLTPIRGYRTPTNRLRRFEALSRRPAGFVVMGDAVCAFNPIYGQGITTRASEALALRGVLQRTPDVTSERFARRVQRAVAKVVAAPWMIATGEDLRWPGVELNGAKAGLGTRFIHRYSDLFLKQALHDEVLSTTYQRMINMLEPPAALMKPSSVLRVLTGTLRRKAASPGSALSAEAVRKLRARRTWSLELEKSA